MSEVVERYDPKRYAGKEPPHRCTAASATMIAQQIPGGPWKYAGTVDSVAGWRETTASVVTPMGAKNIPVWSDGTGRISTQCPYTGQRFAFTPIISTARAIFGASATLGPRGRDAVGAGAPSADQLLASAQANLVAAQAWWSSVQTIIASSQNPNTGACQFIGSAAGSAPLRAASQNACIAAQDAVAAASQYGARCPAAKQAASGAKPCPGLDLSSEVPGDAWGTVYVGGTYCLDSHLVPQVGAQVSQAQASVAAAVAAKNAVCPTEVHLKPIRIGAGQPLSGYVSASADGTYSVDTSSLGAEVDAVAPNFGNALEQGLIQGATAATITSVAVGAVALAAQSGVTLAASTVYTALTAVGTTAGSDALGTLEAAGAASGVGIAVGLAVLVPTVLLTAWPAQAGPGCCGSAQLTVAQATALLTPPFGGPPPTQVQIQKLINFGTCDPGEFNDWTRQSWYQGDSPPYWSTVTGSAEEFIDDAIQAVFAATSTCWSIAPPLAPIAARAVQAWNNTHAPSTQRKISRTVNNSVPFTYQGNVSQNPGQPQSPEPLAVALNEQVQNWTTDGSGNLVSSGFTVPAGATVSYVINDGPLLASYLPPLKPIRVGRGGQAGGQAGGGHPVRNTLLAVAGTAAATAAGISIWALLTGQAQSEAFSRAAKFVWGKSAEGAQPLVEANPAKLLGR